MFRLVDLEAELRNGLRLCWVLDVGQPRLRRPRERSPFLRDTAVRRTEHALVRVQDVGHSADRGGTNGMPAAAELTDDARRAGRGAIRLALHPFADVDDRELLAVDLLSAEVQRLGVGGGPRLVRGAGLRMHLAMRCQWQPVLVVRGWPWRQRQSGHRLLDVAEVLDARAR